LEAAVLVVKSVPKVVGRKSFFATTSMLVMVAATLFGVRVAEADSIWFQSYQRASQEEACVAQSGETPWQDSWGINPGWAPSWEQWANNGQGGWVCSRSITWARDSAARVYNVGDIGPGGGLVFLISGGLTYEMAPKAWGVNETAGVNWTTSAATCYAAGLSVADQDCQSNSIYPGIAGEQTASTAAAAALGMGSANTDAIIVRMNAGGVASSAYAAGAARAYRGGGYTDWFLPSKGELNAMCNYSRNPAAPAAPDVSCFVTPPITPQNAAFASGDFGFSNDVLYGLYWSSSQYTPTHSWLLASEGGVSGDDAKFNPWRVRPIRAF
jgi:hypothetical protein